MSSQRLFDSQVLEMDYPLFSPMFNSQLDPGVWAAGNTLAAPVQAAATHEFDSGRASRGCGLKRKNASQDLDFDFPDTFVEQMPPATIVAIPDGSPKKSKCSQSSSLEKMLQDKLEASESKVRELEAELLDYKSKTKVLQAQIADKQDLNTKLHAKVRDFGLQVVELMREKNVLMAEKHERMLGDLSLIRAANHPRDGSR